jgi:hypothetical protein
MATISKTRPFTCSFISVTIEINDARYSVDPIAPGEFGMKAFRLTKRAGGAFGTSVYDVIHRHDGTLSCDCPDFVARHEDHGGMCKHIRALVELGLMPAPSVTTPALAVAPAPCGSPSEPVACLACAASESTPADVILERGQDLAREEIGGWDPSEVGPDGQPWAGEPEPAPAFEPTPEDETDYRDWSGEADARQHLDHSERLTLAELTDRQIDFYRSWGNSTGTMFAEALERLAMQIRMTGATTPSELAARADFLDLAARENWMAIGHEEGRREALDCPAGSSFGHMA